MAQIDIGKFRGLDLRTNQFNKPFSASDDLLNVELDSDASLKKRNGFEYYADLPAGTVSIIEYKEMNQLIAIGNGLWIVEFGNNRQVTTSPVYTEEVSTVELNGVLYVADPSGANDLYKYDGSSFYRAGMPDGKIKMTGCIGTLTNDYLAFHVFTDGQQNTHYSDYEVASCINSCTVALVDNLYDSGFYNKYAIISSSKTISYTSYSIAVTQHNYNVGDHIHSIDINNRFWKARVVSKTSTNIVLNRADILEYLNDYGVSSFTVETSLECYAIKACVYAASSVGGGDYMKVLEYPIPNYPGASTSKAVVGTPLEGAIAVESEYDITIKRIGPPKCKYVTSYLGGLVVGMRSNITGIESLGSLTREQSISSSVASNAIYWSAVERGTSIESFLPFNFEVIGKTSDGEITGINGGESSLAVMKEYSTYFVDGNLTSKSYRVRSSLGGRIGCVSHKSIVDAMGATVFMSENGLYATSGDTPKEMSDLIEPMFTKHVYGVLDLSKSKSCIHYIRNKILTFIPYNGETTGIVIVYDYYYKEWFLWDNIDCPKGIVNYDGIILFANSSGIFALGGSYSDNGQAINAYYKSAFINNSVPSVRKKYTDMSIFCLSGDNQTVNVKHYEDWNDTIVTDTDIEFSTKTVEHTTLNQNLCHSFSYRLSNSNLNEGLSINGISIEYEGPQTEMKVR